MSDYEQALAGIPMWPADWSEIQSAIDREKALEATIDKIKGVGTMAELRAAGFRYSIATATWKTEIEGCLYERPQLRELLWLMRQMQAVRLVKLREIRDELHKLAALAKQLSSLVPGALDVPSAAAKRVMDTLEKMDGLLADYPEPDNTYERNNDG